MRPSSPPLVNSSAAPSPFLPPHLPPRFSSSAPHLLHHHSSPLSSSSQLPPLPSFRPLPPHLPSFKSRPHCPPLSSTVFTTLSSTSTISSASNIAVPNLDLSRPPPTTVLMPPSQPRTPQRRRGGGRRTAPNSNLQCPTCLQYYSRRDNLRAHQRVHTGERPFSCRYCAQPFRWQGALRNHEGIHIRNGDPLPSDSAARQHRPSSSSSSSSNSDGRNASRSSANRGSTNRTPTNRTSTNRTSTNRTSNNNNNNSNNNNNNTLHVPNSATSSSTVPFMLAPPHHSAASSQHHLFALQHAPYLSAVGGSASNAPSSSGLHSSGDATDMVPFEHQHESRSSVVVTGVESDFPRMDWGGAVLDDLTPRADRSRD